MAGIKRSSKSSRIVRTSASKSAARLLADGRYGGRNKSIAASALSQAKVHIVPNHDRQNDRSARRTPTPLRAVPPLTVAEMPSGPSPDKNVMRSVQLFLEAAQSSGADSEMVSLVLSESADMLRTPTRRSRSLPDDQMAFLIASGTVTAEQLQASEERIARGELAEKQRSSRLKAVTSSLSSAQVAKHLGLEESSVRHRVGKQSLYSFLVGRKRRFPTWQFSDTAVDGVIPELAALVKGIPADMHASTVQGFMTNPQEDLVISGAAVPPVEWLELGNDVDAVIGILDSFLQS